MTTHLKENFLQLEKFVGELRGKYPSPWMKTGWTRLEIKAKKLKSLKKIEKGDELTARLSDGSLKLRVLEKKEFKSKSQESPSLA